MALKSKLSKKSKPLPPSVLHQATFPYWLDKKKKMCPTETCSHNSRQFLMEEKEKPQK